MVKLTRDFPITSAGRLNGWCWSENAKPLSIAGLSINQALSLKLAQKYLLPLLPETSLNELTCIF